MNLTITWQWVLALVVTIGGPAIGLWWVFAREPRARHEFVSTAWLDERLRGRRS
jgi:hypothetical protein